MGTSSGRNSYLTRIALSDGLQNFGILVSGVSFAFTIVELAQLPIADFISRLYSSFSNIAAFIYSSLFFWLNIEPPKYIKSLLTTYLLVGFTAARSAIVYFDVLTVRAGPSITSASKPKEPTGLLGSAGYFKWLASLHTFGSILSIFFFAILIAPIWPYIMLHNHEKKAADNEYSIEYRMVFIRILMFTLIGACIFVFANASPTLYGVESSVTKSTPLKIEPTKKSIRESLSLYRVVSVNGLNLRSGPGLNFSILKGYPNNTSVIVMSFDIDGWFKVKVGNTIGYMYSLHLSKNGILKESNK